MAGDKQHHRVQPDGTGGERPERNGLEVSMKCRHLRPPAQPVILGNIIRHNEGAALNANVNALDKELVRDLGRQTGMVDYASTAIDNQGPLIKQ